MSSTLLKYTPILTVTRTITSSITSLILTLCALHCVASQFLKVIRTDSYGDHLLSITDELIKEHEPKKPKVEDPTRIDVRPCIASKLHFTPFVLDPKKTKIKD